MKTKAAADSNNSKTWTSLQFLFDEAGKTKHVQTKPFHSCIPTTERDYGRITTCTLIYSLPLYKKQL
jgi:hypothetical protein